MTCDRFTRNGSRFRMHPRRRTISSSLRQWRIIRQPRDTRDSQQTRMCHRNVQPTEVKPERTRRKASPNTERTSAMPSLHCRTRNRVLARCSHARMLAMQSDTPQRYRHATSSSIHTQKTDIRQSVNVWMPSDPEGVKGTHIHTRPQLSPRHFSRTPPKQ